jgi:hypothetical protein
LTAEDAAYAIDKWVLDNGSNIPLNFPGDKCPHHVLAIYREAIKVKDTKGIYFKPYWKPNPWQAVVGDKHLGCFKTIQEAEQARDSWLRAQE